MSTLDSYKAPACLGVPQKNWNSFHLIPIFPKSGTVPIKQQLPCDIEGAKEPGMMIYSILFFVHLYPCLQLLAGRQVSLEFRGRDRKPGMMDFPTK